MSTPYPLNSIFMTGNECSSRPLDHDDDDDYDVDNVGGWISGLMG